MYATWKASDKRWAFSLNSSEGAQFIDDDVYAELFAAQSEGRIISVGANGMPITIAPPEVPLCVQRNNALTQLSSWEISERAAGIEHARHHWLTTPEALQDIRDALLAGVVPGGIWVDAERNRVPMALTELQALWTACVERGAAIYQRRLELEAQISQLAREQLEQFSPSW